jgi:hypothetical protein
MTKYKRGYVFYINKALNLACDKLLQHSTWSLAASMRMHTVLFVLLVQ